MSAETTPAPEKPKGKLMKLTVGKTMAIFAAIGIADLAIGIARYPGATAGFLDSITQAFLGIPFGAVADVIQGVLGAISIGGFVITPIAFKNVQPVTA